MKNRKKVKTIRSSMNRSQSKQKKSLSRTCHTQAVESLIYIANLEGSKTKRTVRNDDLTNRWIEIRNYSCQMRTDQHLESMKETMDLEFCPSRMKVKKRHFEKRENGRIYHQEIHITINAKESSLGWREMTPARKLDPQKV